MTAPRVVAFGGGHGLAASLAALRRLTSELTAVVTVADDGGSSGRLRTELGALPPGDLRMALTALAGEDEREHTWRKLVQHRFGGSGPLAGHAVGNLLISGLVEVTGDVVGALDLVGGLLGGVGRVLPLSCQPLDIEADVLGLQPEPFRVTKVSGQVAVATTRGQVVAVRVKPPGPAACPEAVQAVLDADWVVLGPGSWFTSVLPHVLVRGVGEALSGCEARRMLALNLAPQPGETEGFSPEAHLEVFAAHAPELGIDVVLADSQTVAGLGAAERLRRSAAGLGATLVVAPVAMTGGSPRHDPDRLATAYDEIFASVRR